VVVWAHCGTQQIKALGQSLPVQTERKKIDAGGQR
jgi:hypothetical protein